MANCLSAAIGQLGAISEEAWRFASFCRLLGTGVLVEFGNAYREYTEISNSSNIPRKRASLSATAIFILSAFLRQKQ